MKICKWAGDQADEYCKSCDGCTMLVEGIQKSCEECNGYEAGEEDASVPFTEDTTEEPMNPPVESTEIPDKPSKKKKITNSTPKKEKPVKSANSKPKKVEKISEVKEQEEVVEGIKVVSIRYTSGTTIKRGDNYYKFIAEEEWDVSNVDSVQDTRDMLWAKLTTEIDKQIDELNNIN